MVDASYTAFRTGRCLAQIQIGRHSGASVEHLSDGGRPETREHLGARPIPWVRIPIAPPATPQRNVSAPFAGQKKPNVSRG